MKKKGTGYARGTGHVDRENDLKVALENEIKGRNLYVQYANTGRNPLVRRLFVRLANEKLKHMESIRGFIKSLAYDTGFDVDGLVKRSPADDSKRFFRSLIRDAKGQISPSEDDEKSREVAMGIAKAGYEYYKTSAEAAKDNKLRRFFEWLMRREQYHYTLILNAFEYAGNPESWRAGEEYWPPESWRR